jgi:hypothetical protein
MQARGLEAVAESARLEGEQEDGKKPSESKPATESEFGITEFAKYLSHKKANFRMFLELIQKAMMFGGGRLSRMNTALGGAGRPGIGM